MKGSVSIALFFLLSGFFLTILLGAIEHSGKLLAISGGCLAAIVCIIVFLTPVEWPAWRLGLGDDPPNATSGSTAGSTAAPVVSTTASTTSTTLDVTLTTGIPGVQAR
ncbi:MAG: hypothetical protein A2133_03345 [Actinobacteria bacterium RBG_16_64_13]|nr:MAG: hypothetical protein A2133_03345 [Actinobacteria bacterium RBG_16_64_13]